MAVDALWLSDRRVRCELPSGTFEVGGFAPIAVLSHGLEGNSSQRLTHYDPAARPVIVSIEPPYGGLEGDPGAMHTVRAALNS